MKRHGGNLNAYHKVRETSVKGLQRHNSNYRTFQNAWNYGDSENISGGQELGEKDE